MKLQVLVSTLDQIDDRLLDDMNVSTDAIIINQTDTFTWKNQRHRGKRVLNISLPERGIGLSRNSALMRADADICLFADDDVVYENDYEEKITRAFRNNPKADMILFNIPSDNPERPEYTIKKQKRLHWHNSLRYGAIKIAIRLDCQRKANVYFSLLFGGGSKYSAGEDSLFVYQCIKQGLRVYTNPEVIGHVKQETSSWFNGYTDKFFQDKGAFYKCLSPRFGYLFALQYALRKYKSFYTDKSFFEVMRLIGKGIKNYEKE